MQTTGVYGGLAILPDRWFKEVWRNIYYSLNNLGSDTIHSIQNSLCFALIGIDAFACHR